MNIGELTTLLSDNLSKLIEWRDENLSKLDEKLSRLNEKSYEIYADDEELYSQEITSNKAYIEGKIKTLYAKYQSKVDTLNQLIENKVQNFLTSQTEREQSLVDLEAQQTADINEAAESNNNKLNS